MDVVPAEAVLAVLKQLSHDIRDLDVGTSVDRHQKLAVVQFLRDYVAANKPVVLTSVVSHWPAYTNWNDDYLCSLAGDTEVTVALTPNGRADAVTPLPPLNGASSGNGGNGSGAAGEPGSAAGGGQGSPRECFALPHQVKMPLRDFLALLRSSKQAHGKLAGSGDSAAELAAHGSAELAVQTQHAQQVRSGVVSVPVPYLQYQNSSLTAEVPQLLGDVDLLLSWATQAFGGLPEAVNLWIGDERSVTSWHHDPFENIYAVVAGSKTFTLLPPAEVYRMRLRQYNTATYRPVGARAADADAMAVANGALPLRPQLDPAGETVLWSSVPPEPEQAAARAASAARAAARTAAGEAADGGGGEGAEEGAEEDEEEEEPFDLFNDPQLPPPLKVTVKAGEALYLPAMWWHHVEQVPDESGRAIAVNYWYDMKFDARQAYLQAIERLSQLLGLNEEPPPPPAASAVAAAAAAAEEPKDGKLRPPYTTRAFG